MPASLSPASQRARACAPQLSPRSSSPSRTTSARPYTTVLRVTAQKDRPRVFISGRYLETATLTPGTPIRVTLRRRSLVISRVSQSDKHVNPRGQHRVPVIDLNERELAQFVRPGDQVHVRVVPGRVIITLAPLDARLATRLRDGSVGSVFSGVGLLDQAAREAGLRPRWAIERDPQYAECFRANHPDADLLNVPLESAVLEAMAAPHRSPIRPVEVLLAGLPCDPFATIRRTTSAQAKREAGAGPGDHDLIDMSAWLLALIALANPRTVVIECAEEYARSESCASLRRALGRLGYVTDSRVLDSARHGSLMSRTRTALVACTPEPGQPHTVAWPAPQTTTLRVADVLDAHVPASAWVTRTSHPHFWARAASNREKGRGFHWQLVHPEQQRVGTMTCQYGNGVLRIDQPVLVHPTIGPDAVRPFTLTEGRRLFGVSPTFTLPPSKTTAWFALGQAVVVPVWSAVIAGATGRSRTVLAPTVSVSSTTAGDDAHLRPSVPSMRPTDAVRIDASYHLFEDC